jgi:hypothetical protein
VGVDGAAFDAVIGNDGFAAYAPVAVADGDGLELGAGEA